MSKKIYVLYHANCMDGKAAMFAAWKKLGDSAVYLPVQYKQPLPEIEDGSEVYIVDFSYPRNVLEDLFARVSKLVVLDHHETAKNDLEGLSYAHFDMNRSGAMMAWNYFHPELDAPEIIKHVQDRDLWKFDMPDTRAFHAGFQQHKDDLESWDLAASEQGRYFLNKIKEEGSILLGYEKSIINEAVRKTKIIWFNEHRVGIVNATTLISEIGSRICQEYDVDYAIMFVVDTEDKVLLSFRSSDDFNCSRVAKKFGGGGHKSSAGALVDLATLTSILSSQIIKP